MTAVFDPKHNQVIVKNFVLVNITIDYTKFDCVFIFTWESLVTKCTIEISKIDIKNYKNFILITEFNKDTKSLNKYKIMLKKINKDNSAKYRLDLFKVPKRLYEIIKLSPKLLPLNAQEFISFCRICNDFNSALSFQLYFSLESLPR